MYHWSDQPAYYVKSQFYCTAELNILKLLTALFLLVFSAIFIHKSVQHIIILFKNITMLGIVM